MLKNIYWIEFIQDIWTIVITLLLKRVYGRLCTHLFCSFNNVWNHLKCLLLLHFLDALWSHFVGKFLLPAQSKTKSRWFLLLSLEAFIVNLLSFSIVLNQDTWAKKYLIQVKPSPCVWGWYAPWQSGKYLI